jgi:hypothetical protein
MNWPTKAVLISLSIFTLLAPAQSPTNDATHTQVRGYWVDPVTGLMWAGKDNGKDVSWKKATHYCRDLRLASQQDWRLATIDELGQIYNKSASVPGLSMRSDFEWHIKGKLFLTGDQWSSSQIMDDRGHPSGYVWYYNFNEGRPNEDPTGFPYSYTGMRALCVRRSSK